VKMRLMMNFSHMSCRNQPWTWQLNNVPYL
jgi:hypothetical protein